ncbi:SGNH/GDSL hydrolase family protein [Candidatus Pacearchaeota archaeon]|nr:SGNH/GDSL hydrolase family protein [Candidatus Pacearchaeota archaeon]
MAFVNIFIFVIAAIVFIFAFEVFRVFYYANKMSPAYKNSGKFERKLRNPKMRILVTGDSTGFGFGLKNPKESVAGRLAKDFPNADIKNESVSGFTTSDLEKSFGKQKQRKYDLNVFMIGGNDIMKFQNIQKSGENLKVILQRAKKFSKNIVLMPSGNVGLSPIFFFVSAVIFTYRTRRMRKLFMKIAKQEKIMYVDLFNERKDEESLKDINRYYCEDYLHPSGDLYGIWYGKLKKVLQDGKVMKR